jgi:hypothetical protein
MFQRALLLCLVAGCDFPGNSAPDSSFDLSTAGSFDLAGADLSSSLSGDLSVAPPSCTGKTISASGGLDFDIQLVTLTGKYTVNGAPASGDSIEFRSAHSQAPAFATFPMTGSYSVNLAPDTYDITLQGKGRIESGVAVQKGSTVDLAVTTISIGGMVTASGAALTKDEGTITLTGADGTLSKFAVQGGGYGGTVLPGTYDIAWLPGSSCMVTPCSGGIVKKGVAITAQTTIDVDLPMVTISGNISINGAARNIMDGGAPFFALNGGSAAPLTLPNGVVNYTINLLAGSYDIGWQGKPDACGHSPCNRGVFMSGVSLTTSQSLDLPVPMIALSGAITVNHAPFHDGTCGSITFGDAPIPEDASGGYQVNLVPGSYDIGWIPKSRCPTSPWSQATLMPKKSLTANATLDIDVPMVTVTGSGTSNGGKLVPQGALVVFTPPGETKGAAVPLYDSYSANLIPGVFDIRFGASMSGCSQSPCNDTRVRANVAIASSQTIDLDVPMITMSGNITVNGKALTASDNAAGIELHSVFGGAPAVIELGTMPYVINLVPGAFTANFAPDGSRCNLNGTPCSAEVLIDCK